MQDVMQYFLENVLTMPLHEGKWLKSIIKERGIRQEDFAEQIGISRNHLLVLMKDVALSPKHKSHILMQLGINEPDFDVLSKNASSDSSDDVVAEVHSPYNARFKGSSDKLNMWWVPAKAEAGFIRGFAKRIFPSMIERGSMPFIKGECFGFEIDGFSMFPDYLPGTYIVCTTLEDARDLKKDKIYVVQTADGLVIKYFERLDDQFIYVRASNNNYNPIPPIPLDEVQQLYNIEFDMTRPKH